VGVASPSSLSLSLSLSPFLPPSLPPSLSSNSLRCLCQATPSGVSQIPSRLTVSCRKQLTVSCRKQQNGGLRHAAGLALVTTGSIIQLAFSVRKWVILPGSITGISRFLALDKQFTEGGEVQTAPNKATSFQISLGLGKLEMLLVHCHVSLVV
jgi:hypothetical protein